MRNCILRRSPTWAVLGLLGAAGCGGDLHPVRGKVTLDDGTPVNGGMVVFQSKDTRDAVTARGEIQADGSYRLGTHKPGDGVPVGAYRVLIAPPPPENPDARFAAPPFDERYTDFDTSGLEFVVQSSANEFPIQLKRGPTGPIRNPKRMTHNPTHSPRSSTHGRRR
jgi:hypothetical protein